MILWAIQHIDSGTYLCDRDAQIKLFMPPSHASNYRDKLPKPQLYAVVVFRR